MPYEEDTALKLQLIYLERDKTLFAGYGFEYPLIHWNGTSWHHCEAAGTRKEERAEGLSPCEAERCFPNSTTTARPPDVPDRLEVSVEEAIRLRPDKFDDYDGPDFRKAPDENAEYLEQVLPENIRVAIAARMSGRRKD